MSRIKQVYLIALLVITTTSMVSVSRASTTSIPGPLAGGNTASGVISNIAHQEKLLLNSIHSQRAISLAINSLDFQTKIASTHYYFNSIYYEFSWLPNSANPVVTMNTVNVVYSHENSNGTTTNIVATEDSSLASVIKVTVESVVPRNGCVISGGHCQASSNWDGYEFFNHVGTTYNPIYQVRASWTVPQAYVPILSTSGKNCNWPTHCDLSTWVGLSNTAGGGCANGGCIVQGGTESAQQCGLFGCGPNNGGYYYPWYEFLPAASVACGGTGGSNIKDSAVSITDSLFRKHLFLEPLSRLYPPSPRSRPGARAILMTVPSMVPTPVAMALVRLGVTGMSTNTTCHAQAIRT